MSITRKLAFGSLVISLIVLAIKGFAYHVTGSVALFSDALESVINVVSSITALIAIGFAAQSPDERHPYGHHKAEYLSAVIIGAMIVVAGFTILHEAYNAFIDPKPIDAPLLGLGISGIATVMNAVWSWVLIRFGRRERSPALVSDGKHLLADVVTSSGVVIGVGLVVYTGILELELGHRRPRRPSRSVERLGGHPRKYGRIAGRNRIRGRASSNQDDHFNPFGRGDRSARHPRASSRQGHFRRFSSRRARRDDRRTFARDLRSAGGRA